MTSPIFTIGLEFLKNKPYLTLDIIERGSPKRNLYRSTLLGYKQKELMQLLIKEELLFAHVSALSQLADTYAFNKIHVRQEAAPEVLKLLALSALLEREGKKLFFDPFTKAHLFLEVMPEELSLKIEARCRIAGKNKGIEFLFPGEPAWVVLEGKIYFAETHIPRQWLKESFVLTGDKKEVFLEEFENDEEVVWKARPHLKMADPFPFLVLKDAHGAFADLWMDYGPFGKVAFHDDKAVAFRQLDKERAWEKDLLESDFVKKIFESSHYYCPLDLVSKSLSFLIEIGWRVFDAKQREVVRKTGEAFEASLDKEMLIVKGKISYGAHVADVADVLGAFNRRQSFIDLGGQEVALLDKESHELLASLAEEEIIAGSVRVKKSHFGLLEEFFASPTVKKDKGIIDLTQKSEEVLPSETFLAKLYPYQQEGLNWLVFLHKGGLGALLADEMGLGKTVQVLAFISLIPRKLPILVVMPTSVVFNWRREIERFLPSISYYVHAGEDRIKDKADLLNKEIILTSYAYLRIDSLLLQSLDFECIVLDEAQYIKNPDSQVARSAYALRGNFRLVITGTPIENRLEDLWSLFHFLLPELLGGKKEFSQKLGAAELDQRYLKQIKKKVHPFIKRRKKEEVAKDLPPKLEQVVFTEMTLSQRDMYEDFLAKTRLGLLKKQDASRLEILEAILRLRQICCHPYLVDGEKPCTSGKLEKLIEDLEIVVDEGHKVLVFSQFTEMLQLIKKELEAKNLPYVYLDGSTKDRESVVKKFQEDKTIPIFLMSLKAGGVGLNLTAADYVFLVDPWWNEAVENQAIDRAHRIGRASSMIARRYITPLSIEEKIMRLKEHKTHLSKGVLEFEAIGDSLTLQDLQDLLS